MKSNNYEYEIEKLRAEKERNDAKLRYCKNQLKALSQEEQNLERKARNHRIFTRGAMLEGFLQNPLLLTDEQVYSIEGQTVTIDGGTVKVAYTDYAGIRANNVYIKGGASVTVSGSPQNAMGAVVAYTLLSVDAGTQSITLPSGGSVGSYVLTVGQESMPYQTILNGATPAASVTISKKSDSGYIGGSTTSSTTSTVVVDGKTTDAGKVTTTTNADGTKNNTVAVDPAKLEAQVAAADTGSSVVVTVPASTGSANTQIVLKDVENLDARNMSLEIRTGGTTYTVAPNAIDTAKVAAELGASDTSKVPLTVTVTPVKQSDVTVARGTQVADPVKFEVTATYDGKTVAVSSFSHYVERTIAIPAGVDPNKITTGIRVEDSEQVPTFVSKNANGVCTATINSLTNSTYVIVYNEKSFADTAGKWYEKAVTEMASRTIINGKTATTFDGESNVTRAEFAAILTRALGLPSGGSSSFSDVSSSAWCYGSVGAAVKYGIIKGYKDGSFRPNANISREEAMVMLQRAAEVADYAGTSGSLDGFSDASQVGAWAKSAVEFSVGSGLIQGNGGRLNSRSSITRAEAAVVVLRLLQKAKLIDVRTNV